MYSPYIKNNSLLVSFCLFRYRTALNSFLVYMFITCNMESVLFLPVRFSPWILVNTESLFFTSKRKRKKKKKEVTPVILYSICEVTYVFSWLICLFVHDLGRALLHFLDPDKFKSKDDFVQNYKNLSSFNEIEVSLGISLSWLSFSFLSWCNFVIVWWPLPGRTLYCSLRIFTRNWGLTFLEGS